MSRLTSEQKEEIMSYAGQGFSSRAIASLVLGSSTKKSTINDFLSRSRMNGEGIITVEESKDGPVIKVLDVETAPEVVFSFRRFKAFVGPDQVIERGFLMSYSSADLHTGEIKGANLTSYPLFELDNHDDYELCLEIWNELDEADIIIAHNGMKFDRAYINQRFAKHGIQPPSPYIVIDTLRAAKKNFALPANSLKELCLYFDTENFKLDNEGFNLWKECWNGDRDAYARMQTYNDGDVSSLRDLYLKILSWIPQHPNVSSYYKDEACRCPRCGSKDVSVVPGKFYQTGVSTFEVIRCGNCDSLSRGRANIRTKEKKVNTIIAI